MIADLLQLASFDVSDNGLLVNTHNLGGVSYDEAGAWGRGLKFKKLKYLIWHYTAGRDLKSVVARFKDPKNKVSAHFVFGRMGEIVQMVPLTNPAWHAGPDSTWKSKGSLLSDKGLNFYSIGIEIDNPGPLHKEGNDYKTWFGLKVDPNDVVEVDPEAPGSFNVRYWHAYTMGQIEKAEIFTRILVRWYGLVDVLGHSDVCPGRKQDPGPLFPLSHLRSIALSRT